MKSYYVHIDCIVLRMSKPTCRPSCILCGKLLEENGFQRHIIWVRVLVLALINCVVTGVTEHEAYFLIIGL